MKSQVMPPKLRLKLANEFEDLQVRARINPSIKKYQFYLLRSDQIDRDYFYKMMLLFESLMKQMYIESSWGWNKEEKLSEWRNSKTRVILITNSDTCGTSRNFISGHLPPDEEDLIGFMCFRYETGADKKECCLYVYELHICTEFQRQGLGEELMRMAKVLAIEFKMDKIMLTVFRSNSQALNFYQKLKFAVDRSSPDKNEADYTILSCKLKI